LSSESRYYGWSTIAIDRLASVGTGTAGGPHVRHRGRRAPCAAPSGRPAAPHQPTAANGLARPGSRASCSSSATASARRRSGGLERVHRDVALGVAAHTEHGDLGSRAS